MLKKFLKYFVLFILIQSLLVEINCLSPPLAVFKPTPRHLHATTLVDNKLYVLGGMDDTIGDASAQIGGRQFFYLDVSVPFNTLRLFWHDISITNFNLIPSQIGATAVKGGPNNNTIILYGGRNVTAVESTIPVYTFDTQRNSWSIPEISGESFVKRRSLTAIIDNKKKVYLFGGKLVKFDNYVNDMITLDTINFSWGRGSQLNAPTPRINYGAVLLPNQNIIYIGGADDPNYRSLPLNEVYLYDTINDNWSTKKTSGSIPSDRYGLSAVLGLDGKRVIVYGGQANGDALIPSEESLYTLNLDTFEWSIPKVSGNRPTNRKMHKANVIGNYMVVTFGSGYDGTGESDVLLLDISNDDEYQWTTDFIPSPPASAPAPTPLPSSSKNKAAVIGITVGALLGGLAIGMFFLHKWNKNKKARVNVLHISNNKLENQSEQKEVVENNKVDNKETNQV